MMYFMYSKRIAVNPKAGRIVVAMKYFSRIHVFDLQSRYIRSVTTGPLQQPQIRGLNIAGTSLLHTLDMCTTDKRVYILWSGYPVSEQDEAGPGFSAALVFDWDGSLEKVYEIDRAMQIGVSPANRHLFGFGVRELGTFLMHYYLKSDNKP